MPLVVPTTYNEAFKNTCPEKRTVTQTHAFTVKVRMRVCLECFLHPGARSANPWGKYGCKSGVPVLAPGARFSQILDPCPCSWGVFPGILVSGPCSWNVFPGQVCVGTLSWGASEITPPNSASRELFNNYSNNITKAEIYLNYPRDIQQLLKLFP